jgi:ribonucleotide reductase beta subunit family protein with ferritin-like domain
MSTLILFPQPENNLKLDSPLHKPELSISNDTSQYSYFPINYPKLEEYYQRQKAIFWVPQEIDCSKDRDDWDQRLNNETREFLKFILFFFAQADGILNININIFKKETSEYKEARNFYAAQEFIEVIHNEMYSLLIETFIRDEEEKRRAFRAVEYYPSIRKIAEWMFKWMDPNIPLHKRVIAFACIEGIFFCSAFAAIYWIKQKNVLLGLCKANEFIARDEALHAEFAISLYHTLTAIDNKFELLSQSEVKDIIGSAVELCAEFTKDALRVDLIGMNSEEMIRYVKCTANKLVESLGYEKFYHVENPFDWMAVISLPNKTNFFESRVSEYSRSESTNYDFTLEEDF